LVNKTNLFQLEIFLVLTEKIFFALNVITDDISSNLWYVELSS